MNTRRAVFVDVDGTLIDNRGKVNWGLIGKIKDRQGEADFILWSAQGAAYARGVAESLKVFDLFDAVLGKPTDIVDDKGMQWLKYVKPHPPMSFDG
jgi:hydroxymethylpyrimidine pyrophosphatase-like HAD family hydrolase